MKDKILRLGMNFKPDQKKDGTIHFAGLVENEYKYNGGYNPAFKVTLKMLNEVLDNIKNDATGTERLTAYEILKPDNKNPHSGKRKNLAYFKDGYIITNKKNKKELILKLEPIDEETTQRLLSGELQVGSPDLRLKYPNVKSGDTINNVMTGFALFPTNDSYQNDLTWAFELKGNNDNYEIVNLYLKQEDTNLMEITDKEYADLKAKADKFDETLKLELKAASDENLQLKADNDTLTKDNAKLKAANKVLTDEKATYEAELKLKACEKFLEENKTKIFPDELKLMQADVDAGKYFNPEEGTYATIPNRPDSLMLREISQGTGGASQTEDAKIIERCKKVNPGMYKKD